ncbi:DUF6485 family protein [Clostridium sp. Marseille-P2415]|uniref:DUF6485 family protein n=1 Tax=Clostridium sp. Marseille-P2415 TaxID=1805471 RepID=UPI00098873F9
MDQHFCNCIVTNCKHHPLNHSEGCDLCIKKNLKSGEIPTCFWLRILDDICGNKRYRFADFTDFYQKHKAAYEKKEAEGKTETN